MSTVVIAEIANHPARVGDIVSAAVTALPEVSPWVIRDSIAAYPAFAAQITSADRSPTQMPPRAAVPGYQPAVTAAAEPAGHEPDGLEDGAADDYAAVGGVDDDSLEGLNRVIFGFNDIFDICIIRPIAAMYGFVMPDVAKEAMRNAFQTFLPRHPRQDLFQLEGGNA